MCVIANLRMLPILTRNEFENTIHFLFQQMKAMAGGSPLPSNPFPFKWPETVEERQRRQRSEGFGTSYADKMIGLLADSVDERIFQINYRAIFEGDRTIPLSKRIYFI